MLINHTKKNMKNLREEEKIFVINIELIAEKYIITNLQNIQEYLKV